MMINSASLNLPIVILLRKQNKTTQKEGKKEGVESR